MLMTSISGSISSEFSGRAVRLGRQWLERERGRAVLVRLMERERERELISCDSMLFAAAQPVHILE